MSWHFSRALVAEYSEESSWASELSARLKTKNMHGMSWSPVKTMEASPKDFPYGLTYAPFGPTTRQPLEFLNRYGQSLRASASRAASRARTSQLRATVKVWREAAPGYGRKCSGVLAQFDRQSALLRTPQLSLFAAVPELLETLPPWAILSGSELWEQETPSILLARRLRTGGTGCGSWPTPLSRDWKDSSPIPETGVSKEGKIRDRADTLPRKVFARRNWPTPCASDNRDRGHMEMPAIKRRLEKGKQIMLTMAVKENGTAGGMLNPQFTEWIQGIPLGFTSLEPLPSGTMDDWQRRITPQSQG